LRLRRRVHSNYEVPVAGGDVVCLLVCDAIFLVYESCEDVACARISSSLLSVIPEKLGFRQVRAVRVKNGQVSQTPVFVNEWKVHNNRGSSLPSGCGGRNIGSKMRGQISSSTLLFIFFRTLFRTTVVTALLSLAAASGQEPKLINGYGFSASALLALVVVPPLITCVICPLPFRNRSPTSCTETVAISRPNARPLHKDLLVFASR
jgi:hypothetical protein